MRCGKRGRYEEIYKNKGVSPMKRLLTILLIPLLLVHFWIYSIYPALAFADDKVTNFQPVTAAPNPVETSQAPKKGISKWWYALILAAAGGAAAAAGGGGGGGGGNGGSSSGTSTVTW